MKVGPSVAGPGDRGERGGGGASRTVGIQSEAVYFTAKQLNCQTVFWNSHLGLFAASSFFLW